MIRLKINLNQNINMDKITYESGAQRELKTDKSRPDLISPYFQERLGLVLRDGAKDHDERNWELGIPDSSFLQGIERHLLAYKMSISKGLTAINKEEDHLGHLAFNVMALIHNEEVRKLV
jgi:hypothetical protein